ncbi:MAG: tyrosine-type recombinase/integrase [Nocardioidaceae bacterium]
MAHISKTPAGTWRANWRDPAGRKRAKTFRRRRDAERFVAELESGKNRGLYIDPHAGKVKFADYLPRWIVGRNHEATTTFRDQGIMRNHIVPRWGPVPLAKIDHTSVQAWIVELSSRLSPATVRQCHRLFSSVMRTAVRDRTIGYNPCDGVRLPPERDRHDRDEQVISRDTFIRQLLPVIPERYRALVAVAGGTGLRWGECLGLRIDAIDLETGLVDVRRVVIEVNGKVLSKAFPKSQAGRRTVPLPEFAARALRDHIREYPLTRTGEVFTNEAGGPLRRSTWRRRVWRPALVRAGLLGKVVQEGPKQYRATWHDEADNERSTVFRTEPEAVNQVVRSDPGGLWFHHLRHSYATWLVSDNVPINDAQRLLGHSRASTTLDLYTHHQRELDPRVGRLFADFSPTFDDDDGDDGPAGASEPDG